MNPITIRRIIVFLLHAAVVGMFLVILSANVFQRQTGPGYSSGLSFLDSLLSIGSFFALTYFAYFIFLPQYLITGQPRRFVFRSLLLWAAFLSTYFGLQWMLIGPLGLNLKLFPAGPWEVVVFMSLFAIVLGSLFRILTQWFKDAYEKAELERQGLKSELALLKHQLNPHFLFNSLNNIDALIHTQSPKASTALNKLSEMMRYVVYDSEREMVPLEEEIAYIENYIDLQKLRLREPENIHFEVQGIVGGQSVAPMLFISFIENAFKHSSLASGAKGPVEIRFDIQPEGISFRCRNHVGKVNKDGSSGIGLENIRKRLDLIYKHRHHLDIREQDGLYLVDLKLKF